MSNQLRNKRRFLLVSILFLMMFLSVPVNAQAQWKQNSNGTYSYYKDGKIQKNCWVGDDYYVNGNGVRHTGFLNKNGKRYFFRNDGKLLKSVMFTSGGKTYYAGPSGALLTDGKYKIGNYYYGFDEDGVQLRGKTKIKGKTYFFGLKLGQMQVKQWIKTGNKYYYYGKNGVMATNKWVGKYYVNKNGARTNKVKDETSAEGIGDNGGVTSTIVNEQKIWQFFKEKGLNDYAVAGLMGNLYMESALSPINLQNTFEHKLGYTDASYTKAVDSGKYKNFVTDKAGYGLAQWTFFTRKQKLYNYCKAAGTSIGDLTSQLNFLWDELQGYHHVMSVLRSAKSVKQASNVVLLEFEAPANKGKSVQQARTKQGKVYYNRYAE